MFPSNLNVSLDFVSGNIEILGKQNSLFPTGPVIKYLQILKPRLITLLTERGSNPPYGKRWRRARKSGEIDQIRLEVMSTKMAAGREGQRTALNQNHIYGAKLIKEIDLFNSDGSYKMVEV